MNIGRIMIMSKKWTRRSNYRPISKKEAEKSIKTGKVIQKQISWFNRKWESEEGENNTLKDDSPFPFGKYGPPPKGKGLKLKDVPASYWIWLEDQDWFEEKYPALHGYFLDNLDAIEAELEEKRPKQ